MNRAESHCTAALHACERNARRSAGHPVLFHYIGADCTCAVYDNFFTGGAGLPVAHAERVPYFGCLRINTFGQLNCHRCFGIEHPFGRIAHNHRHTACKRCHILAVAYPQHRHRIRSVIRRHYNAGNIKQAPFCVAVQMRQLAKLRMRNHEQLSGCGVSGAIAGYTAAGSGFRLRFYRHSAEHHQLTVLRLVGRVNLDRLCLSAYRHRSVVAVIAGCIGKTEILDIGVFKHKAFQTASGFRTVFLLAPACGVIHRQSVAERTLHEQVIAAASKHSHFGIKIIHHIVVGLVEYEVGEEIHRTCHTGKDPLGFGAHTGAASCRVSAHSYRRAYLFGRGWVVAAAGVVGVVKRI